MGKTENDMETKEVSYRQAKLPKAGASFWCKSHKRIATLLRVVDGIAIDSENCCDAAKDTKNTVPCDVILATKSYINAQLS